MGHTTTTTNTECHVDGCKYMYGRLSRLARKTARHWPRVGLMLGRRLRRRPNIKPTRGQRFMFAWSTDLYTCIAITCVICSIQSTVTYTYTVCIQAAYPAYFQPFEALCTWDDYVGYLSWLYFNLLGLRRLNQATIVNNRWFYFGFSIWPYVNLSID